MCRCSETELNWVSTAMRKISELMQLLRGMSINRYFPAMGTAGFERTAVKGKRRVPRPPPRITASTSFVGVMLNLLRIAGPALKLSTDKGRLPARNGFEPLISQGQPELPSCKYLL